MLYIILYVFVWDVFHRTVDCSQHSQGGATDLTTHISTVMDFVAVFVASINSLFYLFICHQPYQMTDVDSSLELFIATGRTGRRNALANIKDGEVCKTSTASLPFQLEKLQCSGEILSGEFSMRLSVIILLVICGNRITFPCCGCITSVRWQQSLICISQIMLNLSHLALVIQITLITDAKLSWFWIIQIM